MRRITTKPPARPNIAQPAGMPPTTSPSDSNVAATAAPSRPLRSLAGKRTGAPERDYLLLDRSGSMASQWKEAL
jgi:hypothetical protein